jgi:hypothetical protein
MCREQEIVEANGGHRGVRVSVCILGLNRWRVDKGGGGDCVGDETEDVQSRKVDSEADGGLSFPVGYGLGVKGAAPGGMVSFCFCRSSFEMVSHQQRKYVHPSTREIARAKSTTSGSESAMLTLS